MSTIPQLNGNNQYNNVGWNVIEYIPPKTNIPLQTNEVTTSEPPRRNFSGTDASNSSPPEQWHQPLASTPPSAVARSSVPTANPFTAPSAHTPAPEPAPQAPYHAAVKKPFAENARPLDINCHGSAEQKATEDKKFTKKETPLSPQQQQQILDLFQVLETLYAKRRDITSKGAAGKNKELASIDSTIKSLAKKNDKIWNLAKNRAGQMNAHDQLDVAIRIAEAPALRPATKDEVKNPYKRVKEIKTYLKEIIRCENDITKLEEGEQNLLQELGITLDPVYQGPVQTLFKPVVGDLQNAGLGIFVTNEIYNILTTTKKDLPADVEDLPADVDSYGTID